MKAKDLIKILQATPDAEVTTSVYTGSLCPLISIKTVKLVCKGESVGDDGAYDNLCDNRKIAKTDILILDTV